MYQTLAILGAFLCLYSIVAPRIERTVLSGPIIFIVFGVLIGPTGFDLLPMRTDVKLLSTLAELTLALVLLTDAAGADLSVLKRTRQLPIRLLALGLPLSILLGFGFGIALFPGLPLLEVALLATMLAPTDAALGKAVITNDSVPGSIRQGLNVESGLNDGICVPVLYLFLTLAIGEEEARTPLLTGLRLFAEEIGIGLAVATVFSLATVGLLKFCQHHHWVSHTWSNVTLLGLALASFGTAQALGGSGFIACFVGGLLFGQFYQPHHEPLLEAAEGVGDALALLTWVLFGAIAIGPSFETFAWMPMLYAVLSLTVIRMLPVFLSLTGLVKSAEEKLFIGWFGPRGTASIVFAVVVLDAGLPDAELLTQVVVYTVVLSIVLHGLSANPWSKRISHRAA